MKTRYRRASPFANSTQRYRLCSILLFASSLLVIGGCRDGDGGGIIVVPGPSPSPTPSPAPAPTPSPTPSPGATRVDFVFQQGVQEWQAVFADYRADLADRFQFRAGYASVPPSLTDRSGFQLSSFNQSDDVFMGVYRLVDRLRPRTAYRVDATISFATNAGSNCAGIGGSPGKSVYVKAGASTVVPQPNKAGFVLLPLDKGDQEDGGKDMVVIGNLETRENTACDPEIDRYVRKTLSIKSPNPVVQTDDKGRLWLIMGTDSGFEGTTTFYFLDGQFTLTPV